MLKCSVQINSTEQTLLQQIRKKTSSLHAALERTYPYNKLQSNELSHDDLKLFFSSMWSTFSLLLRTSTHPLIARKRDVMDSLRDKSSGGAEMAYHPLSMTYVFVGSLLGGSQVIQTNPKIKEYGAFDYFMTDRAELSEVWTSLLKDLQRVSTQESQQVIDDCEGIFRQLIAQAQGKSADIATGV